MIKPYKPPTLQAEATLDQAAPVQNTWYTVLDTKANCRVWHIAARVDTANETLEIRVTVDGVTLTAQEACTAGTTYAIWFKRTPTGNVLDFYGTFWKYDTFLIEGRSVKVEMRKTTATGAGNLKAALHYSLW